MTGDFCHIPRGLKMSQHHQFIDPSFIQTHKTSTKISLWLVSRQKICNSARIQALHCISHFKSLTQNILRLFKIQLDFFLFCFQVWSGYNRNILENLTIDWLLRVTCAGVVTMGRSLTMEGGDRRGQRTVGVATSALQQGVIMQQSHSWSKQPCK